MRLLSKYQKAGSTTPALKIHLIVENYFPQWISRRFVKTVSMFFIRNHCIIAYYERSTAFQKTMFVLTSKSQSITQNRKKTQIRDRKIHIRTYFCVNCVIFGNPLQDSHLQKKSRYPSITGKELF